MRNVRAEQSSGRRAESVDEIVCDRLGVGAIGQHQPAANRRFRDGLRRRLDPGGVKDLLRQRQRHRAALHPLQIDPGDLRGRIPRFIHQEDTALHAGAVGVEIQQFGADTGHAGRHRRTPGSPRTRAVDRWTRSSRPTVRRASRRPSPAGPHRATPDVSGNRGAQSLRRAATISTSEAPPGKRTIRVNAANDCPCCKPGATQRGVEVCRRHHGAFGGGAAGGSRGRRCRLSRRDSGDRMPTPIAVGRA